MEDRKLPGTAKLEAALPDMPRMRRVRVSFPFEVVHETAVLEGEEGDAAIEELMDWWHNEESPNIRRIVRCKVQATHDKADERIADAILNHIKALEKKIEVTELNAHMTKAARIEADNEQREKHRRARLRTLLVNFLMDRSMRSLGSMVHAGEYWNAATLAREPHFADVATYRQMCNVIQVLMQEGKLNCMTSDGSGDITEVRL